MSVNVYELVTHFKKLNSYDMAVYVSSCVLGPLCLLSVCTELWHKTIIETEQPNDRTISFLH